MKHGNFTGLADRYSSYRPGYSQSVLNALLGLLNKPAGECSLADVGAGTGIWTRMLASMAPASITAVEPNVDMRTIGMRDSEKTKIHWQEGSGEGTNLPDQSVDMLSMASSFHWVDFEKGCKEFHRALKKNGRFVALWNPRLLEETPLLKELEDYLNVLKPDIKRVSSGNSGLTKTLTSQLDNSEFFTDVVSLEGKHTISITPEHYIGAWRSVNDVQFQLGQEKFEEFIEYLEKKLSDHQSIDVTYLTRAWSALKV
ncbi:MAG: methyltransferase domain-containing protein [bacterium]|nr:methyltransferase domain-containing protein [bacterium]